jgi:CRISPR-associated protein Csd1
VDPAASNQDRLPKQLDAFRAFHHELGDELDDDEMRAILAFLDQWSPDQVLDVPGLADLVGGNLVFEVAGFERPAYENPLLRKVWSEHVKRQLGDETGVCLATGDTTVIARTHPSIRGVRGAQTSGAAIVSFNDAAYVSYGRQQSYNAPVGAAAADKYTKALSYLLRNGRNSVGIADTNVVYWCETPSVMEESMPALLGRQDIHVTDERVARFLTSLRRGQPVEEFDTDRAFFILGLAAPSQSRLTVRFWYRMETGELAERLREHLDDTDVVATTSDGRLTPSVWQYLVSVSRRGEPQNIEPRMKESLLRSILLGTEYPRRLFVEALDRIKVGDEARPVYRDWRAGLIRGYLVRRFRDFETRRLKREVPVELNQDVEDAAYQLGRLFAVYEQVQRAAAAGRDLNRTLKDRFYGAASTHPARSFAVIQKLSTAHQKKLAVPQRIYYGNLLDEIYGHVDPQAYPRSLSLEEQGFFALGYHHQRKDLFTRKGGSQGQEVQEDG